MKVRPLVLIALLALCPSAASASTLTFRAILGDFENPRTNTTGTGFASIIVDTVANTLSIDVVFSGLLGTTTASHIHCCVAPPGNAGVATTTPTFEGFPLGVTSGTYSRVLDLTLASSYNPAFVTANGNSVSTSEAVLLAGMLNGQSYLNIHTTRNGGGEIRGAVEAVPEPASVSLLGLGLAIGGWKAWRARRRAA